MGSASFEESRTPNLEVCPGRSHWVASFLFLDLPSHWKDSPRNLNPLRNMRDVHPGCCLDLRLPLSCLRRAPPPPMSPPFPPPICRVSCISVRVFWGSREGSLRASPGLPGNPWMGPLEGRLCSVPQSGGKRPRAEPGEPPAPAAVLKRSSSPSKQSFPAALLFLGHSEKKQSFLGSFRFVPGLV